MKKNHRRATTMISEFCNLSYKRYPQQLELISLEQRRLRGQLNETYKYLNDLNNVTVKGLFDGGNNVQTRNNGQKLIRNFKRSKALNFFTVKITGTWNQLPENTISAGTVNTLKNILNKYWIRNSQVLQRTDFIP
ncbi:hypothetical protein FHG87_009513 [Trinorchestia longiramus]|nr:hypothetical protein FHG87_009513 [Trinorchestia longiramus]